LVSVQNKIIMGKQIIKQPNGKYCIFSSIVDNVTHYDMTVEEIIEEWVNDAKNDIIEKVKGIVSKLEKGEQPYYQSTKSYDDMIVLIKEIHGKKESQKIKSLIETSDLPSGS
jgi:exonuclease VII small subunit